MKNDDVVKKIKIQDLYFKCCRTLDVDPKYVPRVDYNSLTFYM